jgi:HD-GYP domain-containing protein (c-di-GMP phosphodiesterase class II)
MSSSVRVNELQVGMFVHLDLSWMSHPFARSSFKIESVQQIDTIRGLGLKRLRWDPERSEIVKPASELAHTDPAPAVPAPGTSSPAEDGAEQRRRALVRQREASQLCEEQYHEAARAWRKAFDRVASDPVGARRDVEALSQALLDKMLVEGEMCIRVLNTASGDRATAHAMNVSVTAMLVGRMLGLQNNDLAELGSGALLHDVGKLGVPERLRHADERFTPSEFAAYAAHVGQGEAQARRMGLGPNASAILAQHHEMADGSGFPLGLSGDEIAVPARIVALVNRFDNLCNPPSLARALTPHEALSTMFANSRSRFDATVLNAFIRMMGVYPAGSVVQLTDDRYALVISVNSLRPLKPRVLVYDPSVPRDEALYLDLERVPDRGIRRSIRAAQLSSAALDYLAPRARVSYFFESGAVPLMDDEGRDA